MITIVCNSSNAFAQHCAVMLASLFETNKNIDFQVYILTEGFSPENERKIKKLAGQYSVEIILLKPNLSPLEGLPILNAGFSLSVYLRILTAELLPANLHRALYLDCDMVINGTIEELWNTNIDSYAMAATEDLPVSVKHCERLGYPVKDKYINSGVMLINLDYWRQYKVAEKAIDFIRKNPEKIVIYDQDALNAILHGVILILPIKWNMVSQYFWKKPDIFPEYESQLPDSVAHPRIIHFLAMKPWYKECDHPYKYLYYKYLSDTAWNDYQPVSYYKHPRIVLLRQKTARILEKVGLRESGHRYVKREGK